MASATIGIHARRRLLIRSGGVCAFPGCQKPLLEPTVDGREDTNVGIECHIVAQKDSPNVARSVSSLSETEKETFAHLIEDRHGFDNLVMMCLRHSEIIDDPAQDYSVEAVVEMKSAHEAAVDPRQRSRSRPSDDAALAYAEIVDGWEQHFAIPDWRWRMSPLMGGHPQLRQEVFDELTSGREWLFSRVWSRQIPELEEALENFRRVCSDLQAVLSQHPHETLAESGIVAIARFYNDPGYRGREYDHAEHAKLGAMYEFYAELVMDLALELTRAANLVCDVVRERLDSRYRVDEGVVTIESGPYMDFSSRVHRPHYAPGAGSAPYPGLKDFLEDRSDRDETHGGGDPPEGVTLPGEIPLGG